LPEIKKKMAISRHLFLTFSLFHNDHFFVMNEMTV
jgi:hypothetical protein